MSKLGPHTFVWENSMSISCLVSGFTGYKKFRCIHSISEYDISLPANCNVDKSKFSDALEIMKKYVNLDKPVIGVLVMGKVGVGKSTLVNGLIGEDLAKTDDTVGSVTKNVERWEINRNGVHVYVYDTPGFGDTEKEDNDILHEVQEQCKDIDLLLFCLKMTDRLERFSLDEVELITRLLGHDIWKRGMFVLTHANRYEFNEKKHFTSKLEEWETELRRKVKKIIDPGVAEKIPIVPVGFKEPQLPDRPSWVSEVWIQGGRRMSFQAMMHFIVLNSERMHGTTDEMKLSQNMYANPEDQPLIVCDMSKETRFIDLKYYPILFELIGGSLALLVTMTLPVPNPYLVVSFVASMSRKVGTALRDSYNEEGRLQCYNEAIMKSLIAAFVEEYPEYAEQHLEVFKTK